MKKNFYVCLSAIMMAATLSVSFTSCKNDDDDVVPPKSISTIYRSNVVDSLYKYEYTVGINNIKEVNFVFCKHINIIEFTGGVYLKKYQIHSNDCVSGHIKWQADIFGTESDWNHWNDDGKYNRKQITFWPTGTLPVSASGAQATWALSVPGMRLGMTGVAPAAMTTAS